MESEPQRLITHTIESLVSFIEEGFQNPSRTVQKFRESPKCSGATCRVNCVDLLQHFSQKAPWSEDGTFFQWCSRWFPRRRYEEPLNAFFTLPLVAMFLSSTGCTQKEIEAGFVTEFGGRGKLGHNVPSCVWKSARPVSIGKRFNGRFMCADFVFLPPLPSLVAEIKVAMPHSKPNVVLRLFEQGVMKCEEWLAPDSAPFVKKSFEIDRFDYALALLIDFGCNRLDDLWNSRINAEQYSSTGVFIKRIAVGSGSPQIQSNKGVPALRGTLRTRREENTSSVMVSRSERQSSLIPPMITEEISNQSVTDQEFLDFALEMARKCDSTATQQGVDIRVCSFADAQDFVERLKDYIKSYNQGALVPIKNALPWVWRKESKGRPLTKNGLEFGVEIRLSFQEAGNGLT